MSEREFLDFIDGAPARRDLAVAKATVGSIDELASARDQTAVVRKLTSIVELNTHSGRQSEQVGVTAASMLARLEPNNRENRRLSCGNGSDRQVPCGDP
jgi:hypothetical protein